MPSVDTNSSEFKTAVQNEVRAVLRAELNDYIQNASILPIKISPTDQDGNEPSDGDSLKYDSTEKIVRFEP